MNEEIRTLEKVIEQLWRRVTAAAREPSPLNGRVVQIVLRSGNAFMEVHVNGDYAGGVEVGYSYGDGARLASVVVDACDVDREHRAKAIDDFMYRLDRAGV